MIQLFAILLLTAGSEEPTQVEFGRDVQPILSKRCFVCHGPDEGTREARLRLDLPEVVGEEQGVIVPGNPEASELILRITSEYADELMPPPGEEPLTPDEIDILKRWVEQGAEYEGHWAFEPIPETSAPRGAGWVRNEVDGFVLRSMEEAGLEPSIEADRATLIRRLSFDLCGMPPTPAEVGTFVADDRPAAYEELVDRLLATDAYAERMTLAWMDAARYGDTSVHHADGPRDMWPWRDWVIRAYKSNMPFDEFTVEQLAGDLLPEPSNAQLVASGFHRNSPTSDEGGAIDEELRVKYMVDRVKTTGNVWLGLSLECAQCHDHKYDPVSQEDYYRFYAYFNQSVERGFQTRSGNAAPLVMVPTEEQEAELAELDREIQAIEDFFQGATPPLAAFEAWHGRERQALLERDTPELGEWYFTGPFQKGSKKEAYETDHGPEALKIDISAEVAGKRWIERADVDGNIYNLGSTANAAVYLTRTIECERAQTTTISLGSDDSIKVWLNGKEVFANDVGRGVTADQDQATLELPAGESQLLLKIVNGGGPMGYYFKMKGEELPESLVAALKPELSSLDDEARALLLDHFMRNSWEEGVAQVAIQEAAVTRRDEVTQVTATVMIMEDVAEPRMTYVLDRGEYDKPRKDQPVEPGVLEGILPLPEGAPANRLGLAQWLVHPDHPMTARVAVNRYWAMLFGRGLVSSVMDFGSQGELPSHPELLDWLARDFIKSGWDVKRALKQLVMSATYRQVSRADEERLEVDPENELLARASRFRLHGEFLRDQALVASGLLVDEVGGPGVKIYQPEGLWNEVSLDRNLRFSQDHGEKLYRKSMYIYWKRSAPQPAMSTFDTPIRDTCVVQRQRTNTPMQALVTLNDVQFIEAARHLAQRLLLEEEAFNARLDLAFMLLTAHPADELARRVMRETYEAQLPIYQANEDAAVALISAGESARDESLDAAEHATWTVIASMILNLDETLTRE
ncbi:MAG: PSD1 and planctomycete cytochrome C domain-containing protein [Planctomycetes bacterium]|nr:PSD1 and planctomycete cytochrome C domain-containing protein [Planctomycetota bacterium]